jgi:hypothetical protein
MIHDPCFIALPEEGKQVLCEQKVSNHVGLDLYVITILRGIVFQGHHAGIVDQYIDHLIAGFDLLYGLAYAGKTLQVADNGIEIATGNVLQKLLMGLVGAGALAIKEDTVAPFWRLPGRRYNRCRWWCR